MADVSYNHVGKKERIQINGKRVGAFNNQAVNNNSITLWVC